MKISDKELQLLKSYFRKKPVKRAYLFGSYSRGSADEQSDIDILVELDFSHHIGMGFIDMKLELEEMLSKKVDLVSNKAVSPLIQPFISKDRILIYER